MDLPFQGTEDYSTTKLQGGLPSAHHKGNGHKKAQKTQNVEWLGGTLLVIFVLFCGYFLFCGHFSSLLERRSTLAW